MTNLVYYILIGLEICLNLLSIWLFKKSIEVYIVKSKHFSVFKTEFGIFQLQKPGNSGGARTFKCAVHNT